MISSIYQNMIQSFTRVGQKLSAMSDAASNPNTTKDLSQAVIAAKAAEVEARASATIAKRTEEMEKHLLDIVS